MDTNVLIYAAMGHRYQEVQKQRVSETILTEPFGVSGQILAEFYTIATMRKPTVVPLSPPEALGWVERLARQQCVPINSAIVRNGIRISQRYHISYWDGAIVAAAEALGATTLYSEDLNHGQMYGSVQVINPFLEPAA
ncbi:MAG TPA: PIN domain-containing protein [Rhizomicrobium sp.]